MRLPTTYKLPYINMDSKLGQALKNKDELKPKLKSELTTKIYESFTHEGTLSPKEKVEIVPKTPSSVKTPSSADQQQTRDPLQSPLLQQQQLQEPLPCPPQQSQRTVVWSAPGGRNQPTTTVMGEKGIKGALGGCGGFFKKHMLPLLTISGVFGGVALGFILRYSRSDPSAWTKRDVMYVGYLGELFLRALKALIIPLIVSSLVSAIGNLDISMSRKIGFRAITYYMTTTVSAVILGIILVVTIHPGRGSEEGITRSGEARNVTTPDLLMDLIRNLFPPNIVQAAFQSYRTKLVPPTVDSNDTRIPIWYGRYSNWTGDAMDLPKEEWDIKGEYYDGLNIMGLVAFATALGMALAKLGPKGKPLLNMFDALTEASMVITTWLIWISPLGILFLVAGMVLEMKDFGVMLGQLGMYFITVLIGIFIHGFILLPALYTLVTKRLPFRFLANMTQAYITAFATASSSGTLPVTFQCLEEKNKIDPRVTRFVIPIGATINMDGTALYEAVAAIFISQVRGIPLSIGNIIAISITATAAAIGAAGIPQAGLVTMVMVLDVVGLPAEDVTLILAVDWLLDRFRTMINVLGDSVGAGIVYEMSKKELAELGDVPVKNDAERPSGDIDMAQIECSKM